MGLDRSIHFAEGNAPSWDAIRTSLLELGFEVSLRMIDNLPAFPDETPEATWRELRVGFPSGMVALRRGTSRMSCIVWGNADEGLKKAWNGLIWACATASSGTIETEGGPRSAAEFALETGLIPS